MAARGDETIAYAEVQADAYVQPAEAQGREAQHHCPSHDNIPHFGWAHRAKD